MQRMDKLRTRGDPSLTAHFRILVDFIAVDRKENLIQFPKVPMIFKWKDRNAHAHVT